MFVIAGEKNFENKVKKFLKDEGCWLIKYWAGAAYTKTGIPDLLVCCNGCFMGVEIKAPNGKPSELQIYNLRLIDEAGGFGILLYPKDYELFKSLVKSLNTSGQDGRFAYNLLKERWCKNNEHIKNSDRGFEANT